MIIFSRHKHLCASKFSISLLQKYVAQKLVRCLEFTGQAEKFIDHYAHQIQLKPRIGLNLFSDHVEA